MTNEGPLKKQKLVENVQENSTEDTAEREERDYMSSPDMFASSPQQSESPEDYTHQKTDVVIQIENEAEADMNDVAFESCIANAQTVNWRGASIADLMEGCNGLQAPPIKPSENHTVLFRLPIAVGEVPSAYPTVHDNGAEDSWDGFHVRMPFSPQSQYVVENAAGEKSIESRWTIIKKAFSEKITSSHRLADAILSYNSKYADRWDFNALHYFINEELEAAERDCLLSRLVPAVAGLALLLPELLTAPLPLLRRHRHRSVSLSQLQVASLLANAFLCTFPRRNAAGKKSEYATFPDVNFNRLFSWRAATTPPQRNLEKLKCIFNYFRRVTDKYPTGVLTFTRRHLDKRRLPRWDRLDERLPALHVASAGTIEDNGAGMLQADFANSFVGGGVLGSGCVQEEIRFVICPELIVSRLFTEQLDATEALVIIGCERFSDYSGYSDSFCWTGNHADGTERDGSSRIRCAIVAMDALYLRNPVAQFAPKCLLRELNKAFVGCADPDSEHRLAPFATGNWGCGAFGGDPALKAVLQLMAAAAAGRDVAYFTFGDRRLRDALHDLHAFLRERRVTVARLWDLLSAYHRSFRDGRQTCELYAFLYESVINGTSASGTSEKPATSAFDRHSQHKLTDLGISSDTRRTQRDASSSRQMEDEDLELALEESLREQTFLREAVPPMDDATREAKLALIESSGKMPSSFEKSGKSSASDREAKSTREAKPALIDSSGKIPSSFEKSEAESSPKVEQDLCCDEEDCSPDMFASLLLENERERDAESPVLPDVRPADSASSHDGKDAGGFATSGSAGNCDRKAETKSSGGDTRSPLTKKKITDYFSGSPRYK